ncbi:GNAT family N-acetyltransferase [Tessaracoccus antarcticus]|uniref:GNAT family N-acetyltransferase n=1 Tax=Tessaracoccus antarcticus TaxID=2479848 RepID=A0A3M0GBN5_9ACTN|nr:GNAT family N-acetyltransferase [Tessaracoccus antarcticus]RMB62240.1 GNAT family N-acetyltransferase [Tessaracoccus antarcticus]
MNASKPVIVARRWSEMSRDEVFEMMLLRTEVFFVEQRIDEQDFDAADRDDRTLHLWIADDDGIAAYLRVAALGVPEFGADRTFGRVAVRINRRGGGLARRLVREVVERCGHAPLTIHAQTYVVRLYEDFGFTVVGEPFVEAGLPHRTMVRPAR